MMRLDVVKTIRKITRECTVEHFDTKSELFRN